MLSQINPDTTLRTSQDLPVDQRSRSGSQHGAESDQNSFVDGDSRVGSGRHRSGSVSGFSTPTTVISPSYFGDFSGHVATSADRFTSRNFPAGTSNPLGLPNAAAVYDPRDSLARINLDLAQQKVEAGLRILSQGVVELVDATGDVKRENAGLTQRVDQLEGEIEESKRKNRAAEVAKGPIDKWLDGKPAWVGKTLSVLGMMGGVAAAGGGVILVTLGAFSLIGSGGLGLPVAIALVAGGVALMGAGGKLASMYNDQYAYYRELGIQRNAQNMHASAARSLQIS